MPVIINEILIRSTVETSSPSSTKAQESGSQTSIQAEELVKQAVEKVLELLEEKKHR